MFQPRDLLKVLGSLRALQSQPHGRRRGVRTLREEVGGAGVGGAAGVTGKFLQICTFCNWNTFCNNFSGVTAGAEVVETRVPIEVVEKVGVRVDLGKNSNGVF